MATLDSLLKELTPDQCLEALVNIVDTVGVPSTAYQEGSVVRTLLEADSDMMSYTTWVLSGIAASGFLETAAGEWLDLVAIYGGSGLYRNGASYAQGSIELTNTTGGTFTAASGALTVRNSNTGKQYRNVGAISVANNASAVYTFEAVEAGAASNAAAGEITSLTTSVSGVAVANTTTFVGLDQESDESLRSRLRFYHQAKSSFGPSEAYHYWAKQALKGDGTPVGVTKVKTISDGSGTLTVVVASDAGAIPAGPDGIDSVDAILRTSALTQGPTLIVQSAVEHLLAGTVSVYAYNDANLTTDDVQDLVLASLTDRVKALPIGGDNDGLTSDGGAFYRTSFLHALQPHEAIFRAESTTFTADIALDPDEVVRLGTFVINVNFRARPV